MVVTARETKFEGLQKKILKFDLKAQDFDDDLPFVEEFLEKQESKQLSKRKQELNSHKVFMSKTSVSKANVTSENIKWDEFHYENNGIKLSQDDKFLNNRFDMRETKNVFNVNQKAIKGIKQNILPDRTQQSFRSIKSKNDSFNKICSSKSLRSTDFVKKHSIVEHFSGYKVP